MLACFSTFYRCAMVPTLVENPFCMYLSVFIYSTVYNDIQQFHTIKIARIDPAIIFPYASFVLCTLIK